MAEVGDAALELLPVTFAEFFPPCRIMVEPLAKFGRGGKILGPLFDGRALFRDAARPDAIDQHAETIFVRRRIVYATTHEPLKFAYIVGVTLISGGLIGVWIFDLRSRQLADLPLFAEALRNIAVFYDGVVVPAQGAPSCECEPG